MTDNMPVSQSMLTTIYNMTAGGQYDEALAELDKILQEQLRNPEYVAVSIGMDWLKEEFVCPSSLSERDVAQIAADVGGSYRINDVVADITAQALDFMIDEREGTR